MRIKPKHPRSFVGYTPDGRPYIRLGDYLKAKAEYEADKHWDKIFKPKKKIK